MKKSVVILISMILLACFSLMANGLNDLVVFNDSTNSKLLDFSSNHDLNAYVNLVSHAFVISTTLGLEGFLSDWETVSFYNSSLNNPYSGKYISSNSWLITDETGNKAVLVNPSTDSVISSFTGLNSPWDAERVSDDIWFVADEGNQRVIKINVSSNSILWNYNTAPNEPTDVDVVSSDSVLITTHTNPSILLVNTTTNQTISNITSNINNPFDAEVVNSSAWLVVDNNPSNRIKMMDPNTDTITWQYAISDPWDVELLNDGSYLVVGYTSVYGVFNLNLPAGTMVANFTNVTDPRDVEFIDDNEWLVTDKSGPKYISLEKKYYPNNLTMSVGGSLINSWADKFNLTDTVTNFTNALNNYLSSCVGNDCDIPFSYHSDTSGRLNLSLLNISYNRKPFVNIVDPTTGDGWTNIQNYTWNMTDDDNDALSANSEFYNCTAWIGINQTIEMPGVYTNSFNTTVYADDDCYKFKILVNDSYNNASDETGNFTIDNTNPSISNLIINDSDEIVRSDINFTFSVNAYDLFMQTVSLNGSAMTEGAGNNWSVISTAAALGCSSGANTSCSLTATATDIVNRQNSTSLTIVIDDVNPTIWNLTSNATSHQADYDEWVNFTVQVSDDNLAIVNLENLAMTQGGSVWYKLARPSDLGCSAGTVCELNATATDDADNTNSTTYNLTVNAIFNVGSSTGGGSSNPECDDNKDNDGDGLIDMDDPGCTKASDRDESSDGGACREDWICSDWGECENGKQTRTCEDANGCGTTFFRPVMNQDCVMPSSGLELTSGEEPPVVVTPTNSPVGVGQATSLFDRIKANWWAVILGLIVLGGLAAMGWKKDWFKRKKNGP
ncbi:hypothetical protein ACFLZB_03320 [Nanoarchaeota archaeon]